MVPTGGVAVNFRPSDREALQGARIRLRSADGERATLRGWRGCYADLVAGGLVPGSYEVVVELGGRARRFPVEVRARESEVVEVTRP